MARKAKIIPFPRPAPPAEDPGGLVAVHRCDQAEALVVKGLLDSHAIPAVLRSRLAHSVHPFTVGAQGEVVVLVPAAESARARRLLADIASGRSAS